ncbi:MAG: hypothetical protein K2H94_06655, partial [Duncaniella sp.]|nr:hypothetical protein [Duncaniella sp.]
MPRIKISQAAKEFNVSIPTMLEQLQKNGITVDSNPNTRLDENAYSILLKAFQPDRSEKAKIDRLRTEKDKAVESKPEPKPEPKAGDSGEPLTSRPAGPRVIGHIKLDAKGNPIKEEPKAEPKPEPKACHLDTADAADDQTRVHHGGRRSLKKR